MKDCMVLERILTRTVSQSIKNTPLSNTLKLSPLNYFRLGNPPSCTFSGCILQLCKFHQYRFIF